LAFGSQPMATFFMRLLLDALRIFKQICFSPTGASSGFFDEGEGRNRRGHPPAVGR
jgi:hypothetical protein